MATVETNEPRYSSLQEAVNFLETLPTANAVADELVSMEIEATRHMITKCALAEYFKKVTPYIAINVTVEQDESTVKSFVTWEPSPTAMIIDNYACYAVATAWGHPISMLRKRMNEVTYAERVRLSPMLLSFIRKFDDGEYDKLLNKACPTLQDYEQQQSVKYQFTTGEEIKPW